MICHGVIEPASELYSNFEITIRIVLLTNLSLTVEQFRFEEISIEEIDGSRDVEYHTEDQHHDRPEHSANCRG
jgi:hypothetical protein